MSQSSTNFTFGHASATEKLSLGTNPSESPISILPPEVLCLIFARLQCGAWDARAEDKTPVSIRNAFSQVCRGWREAALSDPTLWRYLTMEARRPWTNLLLQRSRAAPLLINVKRPYTNGLPSLEFAQAQLALMAEHIPPNLDRTEELSLFQFNIFQLACLFPPIDDPRSFPLRRFSMIVVGSETMHQGVITAFILKCPRLESLVLSGPSMFRLTEGLPSSLTTIDLVNQPRPSTMDFLRSVRALPRLQVLRLRRSGPLKETWDPSPTGKYVVDLPHLRILTLPSLDMATEVYYRYLNIPPSCNVEIECRQSPAQPSPQSMIQYLSERFESQTLRWPVIRRAHLLDFLGSLQIVLFPNSPETKEDEVDAENLQNLWVEAFNVSGPKESLLRVRFEWDSGRDEWFPSFPDGMGPKLFCKLYHGLPLHNLQYLCLMAITDLYSTGDLDDLVGGLPELLSLSIHAPGVAFWKTLINNQDCNLRAGLPVPLPKLLRLHIILDEDMQEEAENASALVLARAWLIARHESNARKLRGVDLTTFSTAPLPPSVPALFADLVESVNQLTPG